MVACPRLLLLPGILRHDISHNPRICLHNAEVHTEDVEEVALIVRDCMESAVNLRVPLQVSMKSGRTWGSMV